MGKVNIIIECDDLSPAQIADVCRRNLGALTTALELNNGYDDRVDVSIVIPDDNELVSVQ